MLFRHADSFIAAMLGNLNRTGIMWARIGVVVLIVAAAMSWSFGAEVSWKHAAFLACLTFVAAFGPEAAYKAWEDHKRGSAIAIALVCAPLLAIEFYSHAGYTAGLRGHNIETTQVQNVRYDQRQDDVKDNKASLELWTKRLAELEAQHGGWITSTTADALRAQLASANLAIEQEAARGGCKAKCLARTQERDQLASRIAIAEEKDTLTKQLEATKRVLAKARDTAAVTEHKSSPVLHQNAFLAKAVTLVGFGSLEPTPKIAAAAEQSANLAMAIAGTGLPAFCLFMAGLYRLPRRGVDDDEESAPAPVAAPEAPKPRPIRQPAISLQSNTIAQLRALAAA